MSEREVTLLSGKLRRGNTNFFVLGNSVLIVYVERNLEYVEGSHG